jgi:glycosyltransferase involved in cell wall biosynthesis
MTTATYDLSVIIPARNESAYVETSLNSVYNQAHPRDRIEAIVAVNGCTDDTEEVVKRWSAAHPDLSVRIVESAPPGLARARNTGAAIAQGDTMIFLDADSQMPAGMTKAIVDKMRSGTVISTVRIAADTNDRLDQAFYWIIEIGKVVLRAHANFFFVDRKFFERTGGYDAETVFAEDLEYLQRLSRAGTKIPHMRNPAVATSSRRLHEGPLRIGWLMTLLRWAAIRFGIGRRWRYW